MDNERKKRGFFCIKTERPKIIRGYRHKDGGEGGLGRRVGSRGNKMDGGRNGEMEEEGERRGKILPEGFLG